MEEKKKGGCPYWGGWCPVWDCPAGCAPCWECEEYKRWKKEEVRE